MRRGIVLGWILALVFAVISVVLLALLAQEKQTTQALALVLSATKTPTPTDTPTSTFTLTPTLTPTFTPSPTNTVIPTDTPTPAPTSTPRLVEGAWKIDVRKSNLGADTTVIISVASDEKVITSTRVTSAFLYFRCKQGQFDMYVTADIPLDSDKATGKSAIRFRFDEEKIDAVQGDISTSNDAVFFTELPRIVDLMKTHKKMAVQLRDTTNALLDMVFTVDGFDASLKGMATVCK